MAEVAPLTTAHAHSRKAAKDTGDANWSSAGNEYQNAADDFARAAKTTTDNEALRVLKLLEDQHLKIAQIIQSRDIHVEPQSPPTESAASPDIANKEAANSPTAAAVEKPTSPALKSKPPGTSSMSTAAARIGSHTRDTSPSLAREIASRRGIPIPGGRSTTATATTPLRTPQPASTDTHRRPRTTNPRIPPSIMDSQADLEALKRSRKLDDDEGFAKFYSNITTGTMSKLTAALAFAGLPLTNPEPAEPEPNSIRHQKKRVPANNDPDVKKIFSKAALDAVAQGNAFGPAESFYLVPGTKSYADIAKLQQHQQQQSSLSQIGEDDEEAFVDAREVLGPPSPRHSRRPSGRQQIPPGGRGAFGKARTQEELELENVTLKEMLQDMAGRLGAFEMHAQDESMADLTRSMASVRSGNPARNVVSGGQQQQQAQPGTEERLRELEAALARKTAEEEQVRAKAAVQEKTLKKWEKRFEMLKTSAREKDKAKRESLAAGKGDGDGASVAGASEDTGTVDGGET